MIALGGSVHIFARPHRRQELAWCFETALGWGPVRTAGYPGIDQPVLIVSFPGGGIGASSSRTMRPAMSVPGLAPGLSCAPMNPAVPQDALDAGLTRVSHPGHPYCVMAPGGQVLTIAPAS